MDADQFDDVLRSLSQAPSRRGIVRALGGIALAGPLAALLGRATVEAKKKGKNKKKKKKCKKSQKKCGKKCIPATNCCTDANCGNGGACVNGTCTCSSGFKPCNGACVPEADCCDAADCDDGNPCTDNVCSANGTCSHPNSPELTNCGGGKQCSGGVCAFPPTCQPAGSCIVGVPGMCCSGVCLPAGPNPNGVCQPGSEPGEPCLVTQFCLEGTCVGFVCTA